jgi:hypothetical protein
MILAWMGSHGDTDLARQLGMPYLRASVAMARRYLAKFG